MLVIYMISFIVLFGNFYAQAYIAKEKVNQILPNNNFFSINLTLLNSFSLQQRFLRNNASHKMEAIEEENQNSIEEQPAQSKFSNYYGTEEIKTKVA